MSRFNCDDCVLDGTDACRFGVNKSKDRSEYCDDLFVEHNHAYEKGRAGGESEGITRVLDILEELDADLLEKVTDRLYEQDYQEHLKVKKENMNRTLENCILIKQIGSQPNQYDGKCEGFAKGDNDDEPCEKCKECSLNVWYDE